jgi:hypothetical protein
MSKSEFVCRRCGLAVHTWAGGAWKHAAGAGLKSCGKPPIVETRADYQARMDALVSDARAALGRPA